MHIIPAHAAITTLRAGHLGAVVTSCEARDAEAVRQITAPWWSRLWPG